MCGTGQSSAAPANVAEALAMADAAADYLNRADLAGLAGSAQSEALLVLERLDGKLTAAHAKLTAVFAAAGGPQADGAYSAKTWLRQHARLSSGAAGARVAWARRLAAHPPVAGALAAGDMSPSWARQICDWTSGLPAEHQRPADDILVTAAGQGAALDDLGVAAEEIHRRTSPHDPDDEAALAFPDRAVYLGRTLGGAGRLEGNLTPAAAASLSAVLDSLGGRAGPEDLRSLGQRNHDALAEACRRLIGTKMLPGRAGQDTRAEVTIPLRQLRQLPGAASAENSWIAAITGTANAGRTNAGRTNTGTANTGTTPPGHQAATGNAFAPDAATHRTGRYDAGTRDGNTRDANTRDANTRDVGTYGTGAWARRPANGDLTAPADPLLVGAEGAATACDTTIVPIVTGQVNGAALDKLTESYLASGGQPNLPESTRQRLRTTLLRQAIEVVSGPGGLAAHLRTRLLADGPQSPQRTGSATNAGNAGNAGNRNTGSALMGPAARGREPLAAPSLPLDIGQASEIIPAHLRRAVTSRDRRCAFPGCQQPPAACQVHHIIPRRDGGATALHNLILLCRFHHLVVVHDWGWSITLHPDATATATSPDGRTLHSHDPPRRTA